MNTLRAIVLLPLLLISSFAEPNLPQGEGAIRAQIVQIDAEIASIKDFMTRARFTPEGLKKKQQEIAALEARKAKLQSQLKAPSKSVRPAVSPAFAKKHPAGSYAPGELLVGTEEKGLSDDAVAKLITGILPGTTLKKGMFNNSILHLTLPASKNVEQGIKAFSKAKGIKCAELNGTVRAHGGPGI